MRLLDYSFASPAENLALDEALLDEAEAGGGGEVLRVWESPVHFVVLGLSQAVDDYVIREACASDAVPILRRCSAGGCVLQGSGCLNYSLILRSDRPGCGSIHASYETILGTIAAGLRDLGCPAVPAGISDLALDGVKVSGSAQRRRKYYFLHHGTLLYAMDLDLCTRYLQEPPDQPSYRATRTHNAFLGNLPIELPALRLAVSKMFQPADSLVLTDAIRHRVRSLASEKYSRSEWTFRK